jgi:hypothetical protein
LPGPRVAAVAGQAMSETIEKEPQPNNIGSWRGPRTVPSDQVT